MNSKTYVKNGRDLTPTGTVRRIVNYRDRSHYNVTDRMETKTSVRYFSARGDAEDAKHFRSLVLHTTPYQITEFEEYESGQFHAKLIHEDVLAELRKQADAE